MRRVTALVAAVTGLLLGAGLPTAARAAPGGLPAMTGHAMAGQGMAGHAMVARTGSPHGVALRVVEQRGSGRPGSLGHGVLHPGAGHPGVVRQSAPGPYGPPCPGCPPGMPCPFSGAAHCPGLLGCANQALTSPVSLPVVAGESPAVAVAAVPILPSDPTFSPESPPPRS